MTITKPQRPRNSRRPISKPCLLWRRGCRPAPLDSVRDLAEAIRFYQEAFGCAVGRQRDEWADVWFFGLQLTLQHRPTEVRPPGSQGVRHFGVTVGSARAFEELIERVRLVARATWLQEPTAHDDPLLTGKTGAKVADPSGNIIEIKHYDGAAPSSA